MPDVKQVSLDGERYLKLSDSNVMRPFLMSIISDGNHWMFISSNGGLSAGRKNSDFSLFPYTTDDKLTNNFDTTGSKSIFRVTTNGQQITWEPFTDRNRDGHEVSRNIYKSIYGNKVRFEEVNHDLSLSFCYEWSSSNKFGFLRKSWLSNFGDQAAEITLVDGIQNIVPAGVGSELQNHYSNLIDAYKRSELEPETGLGIFALSAIIVDKAEPSEALKANVAWSLGAPHADYLLSPRQLDAFRRGKAIVPETDVKGERGAYLIHDTVKLESKAKKEWWIVANVNQDHAAVAQLIADLDDGAAIREQLSADVAKGTDNLIALGAAVDGLQLTADNFSDTRHFANVMFNIMRGGIIDNNYLIERDDFTRYLRKANPAVSKAHHARIAQLDEQFDRRELLRLIEAADDADFSRLGLEYLPLKFSRRHGDPSRPWNRFSINTQSEVDGSKILDYEGNWRDIFQNWEAVALAFPYFLDGMISKFLNASTFDGYNPYRVTKSGFDWETIEADDPWSYIGYWGDHQIIYLLKFLEVIEDHQPGKLVGMLDEEIYVYANVPYRIKPYRDILKDPKDTIEFDRELDTEIRKRRAAMGADGALLRTATDQLHRVSLIEKLLATVLAKISNFIPGGGIWMNTQRPEWNDANNALVGNGVSMVTLYYLRRFLGFFYSVVDDFPGTAFRVSAELTLLFNEISETLIQSESGLNTGIGPTYRRTVMDELGTIGSEYRDLIYKKSFSGAKDTISLSAIRKFLSVAVRHLDHSIAANKRDDDLYHAYNLVSFSAKKAHVSYLSEMLEGQVAVLSTGNFAPASALKLLDSLKASALYREDQYTYLLYPNKQLPGFLEKNTVSEAEVEASALLTKMVEDGNGAIVVRDVNGKFHFNGNFTNARDVKQALDELANTDYAELADRDRDRVLAAFEAVFNHQEFTGRSGTFYGYEGLGSTYWHMVSKLRLAVLENCEKAIASNADDKTLSRLIEHYYAITAGIGLHKPAELYGAFPIDPYSHTPAGKGAQQPGMTGQVKEDVLCRIGELGAKVEEGKLMFRPFLLRRSEFLEEGGDFSYVDVAGKEKTLAIPADSLAFTYCQVPVVYTIAVERKTEVFTGDTVRTFAGKALDPATSERIFRRHGAVTKILVSLPTGELIN